MSWGNSWGQSQGGVVVPPAVSTGGGTIPLAIQEGLLALRGLAIQTLCTYRSVGVPSYVPSTGVITATPTNYTNVPAVFTSFSRREIDGEAVREEDQKAIIATLDLAPVPTVNDTIVRADSTVWNVIGIRHDPAGAAWVLHVRRP